MKRTSLLLGIALAAFVILSQTGAEATNETLADRFVGSAVAGETGTYNFDKAHSVIGFKVKHNGLIEIPGFFRDFTGTVNYDAKDVTKSTVEFTAKATSVDTGVAARDNHLRSKDFFEIEKFPEITFKSTKVEQKGKGWVMTGDFTMKGVTKSMTFPFSIVGFIPASERAGTRMGIWAETKLNRRDFGVNYGTAATIADEISIELAIEAPMPRPAAAPAQPKTE